MRPFGKSVLDKFYKAAYCYRREHFYRYLSSIRSQKPEAFEKITKEIPIDAWARCFTPVRRYGFMTSNSCESLNNKLLWARMLPVCSLLECVRATIEKWFAVRRASAEGRNHPLTQWTQLRLDPLFEKGRTLSITTLGMQRYKVMEETRSYMVDLEARTCECCVFQTDLLPCLHASTAIREAGLDIMDFVNDHYKTYSVARMYQSIINPVPHPDEWQLPPEIMCIKVIPPNDPKQAGRPRTQRYSAGEGSSRRVRRQQMCSRCGVTGHNRAKCPQYDGVDDFFSNEEGQNAPTPRTTSRRPRRCRTCKETGHKSSSCPSRPFHDILDEDEDVM